jgi:hypothetical protein
MTRAEWEKVTIVVWYGEKPAQLLSYIETVQQLMQRLIGPVFIPRPQKEVHATVVGLEQSTSRASITSLMGMLYMLKSIFDGGVSVQFGGYERSTEEIISRGLPPYDRTICFQGQNCITIGWPTKNGSPTMLLDETRWKCAEYGFPHKYHEHPGAEDPDMYMVIGSVCESSGEAVGMEIERSLQEARRVISREANRVIVCPSDVSLVRYKNTSLPFSNSSPRSIEDIEGEACLREFLQSSRS